MKEERWFLVKLLGIRDSWDGIRAMVVKESDLEKTKELMTKHIHYYNRSQRSFWEILTFHYAENLLVTEVKHNGR